MTNTKSTLLAHLVSKVTGRAEVLATEALNYILNGSAGARRTISSFAEQVGVSLPDGLQYSSQESLSTGDRPDLTGRKDAVPHVFIELKFNACLTGAQPVTYLRCLSAEPGFLLVVVPEWRKDLLWIELMKRCQEANFRLREEHNDKGRRSACWTGGGMLLVTWSELLEKLKARLLDSKESSLMADVLQLEGLCRQMDTEAFLPLESTDLSPEIGKRFLNFCDAVDAVTQILTTENRANLNGLRASGGRGWYGRYMRLDNRPAQLMVTSYRWSKWGQSPIWLEVFGADWKVSAEIAEYLSPDQIDCFEEGGRVFIPVRLLTGVEEHELHEDMIRQIDVVMQKLPRIQTEKEASIPFQDPATASDTEVDK